MEAGSFCCCAAHEKCKSRGVYLGSREPGCLPTTDALRPVGLTTNVDGVIHAETTNGGLILNDLGGDVLATTVNGGLHVRLDGNRWRGGGLVAKSTNGGVSVRAPDNYSAHLVAETVNGGVSIGFPATLQGKMNRNYIDTHIGQGGATLHFQTVNGGVSINRD
jgi:DUF4097 and DUF4098 domain-containing protein YvlB